ncbi:M4 family metallopeptidase [Streptomyces sp. NPDC089919]|uniref:M4 family metallopeptidase n=1 Tax=Streptomyces sp. NPDC089919 TaxID=3155188 RepID=UPI003432726A
MSRTPKSRTRTAARSTSPRLRATARTTALALVAAAALAGVPAQAQTHSALDADASALRLGAGQRLVLRDTVRTPDGTVHVRYDRTYAGLPVLGGDLVVHRHPDGRRTTTWAGPARLALGTTPAVAAPAGARPVVLALPGRAPALAFEQRTAGARPDGTPTELRTLTDARTGALLRSYDATPAGTGYSQYSGTVTLGTFFNGTLYELHDRNRGAQKTYDAHGSSSPALGTLFTDADNTWGNGSQSNRQTAGVDAHYGAAATWDFFRGMFGRNGVRGDGRGIASRVHVGPANGNAWWSDSCGCISYSDSPNGRPYISLDIAGHEISHGVTSATANLTYAGEPGGLNEATSDIFGSAIEFAADNPTDLGDYLIGERVGGTPVRSMDRPSRDGVSPDYWSAGIGNTDPHYASGPAEHFFYLLAEGSGPKTINGVAYDSPTYDGSKLLGIGRDAATRIWYLALTTRMTSSTNYAKARVATLSAAADLYGSGSPQFSAVAATWSAVNVH